MKQINLRLLMLGMALGLAACGKAPQNNQGVGSNSVVSGIIGGESVSAQDPMAHTTVQVYAFVTEQDPTTGKQQTGLAGCTGSLVSEDVILTAGHCSVSDPSHLFIYFSKDVPADMRSFVQSYRSNPLVRQVVGGVTHPLWAELTGRKKKNWGDLSLLKIQGTAPAGYTTASLISSNAQLSDGMPITLAGFGLVQPFINGNQVNTTELRKVTVAIQDANYSKTEIMLATDQGKGSCHGDSGGPGFVSMNGQDVIAGITSRADSKTDPQGECVGLTVYTAIAPYVSWISETVSDMDSGHFQSGPIAEPRGM